jgi:hypothetical protein
MHEAFLGALWRVERDSDDHDGTVGQAWPAHTDESRKTASAMSARGCEQHAGNSDDQARSTSRTLLRESVDALREASLVDYAASSLGGLSQSEKSYQGKRVYTIRVQKTDQR